MNEIRKEVFLAAPLERVWQFLTDKEKLSGWLMDNDIELEEGARFKYTAPPSGAWDGNIFCEIVDIIEHERLSYTWNANDIGVDTLVTLELSARKDGTQLVLTHGQLEGAAAGAAGRHAAGWTNVLKRLEVALVGPSTDYDWSAFQITLFVEASIDTLYKMWTTTSGMSSFWSSETSGTSHSGEERQAGDTYLIGDRFDLSFTTGGKADIEILNIEDNKFLLFSFGEAYGWVRVELEEVGRRTKVVLHQFGMPIDDKSQWEVHAHARGWWVFNLMNMKSVAETGIDLRDTNPATASALGMDCLPDGSLVDGPHDWKNFDVRLWVSADPEDVLRMWRTVAGMESFFIKDMEVTGPGSTSREDNEIIEAGDVYQWSWAHDHAGKGKYLKSENRQTDFTFGSDFIVRVKAAPSRGGAMLCLHQEGMSDTPNAHVQDVLNCRSCWIYFLAALKAHIEHGFELRDLDPETADAVSVGYNILV